MIKNRIISIIIVVSAVLVFSCTGEPPQILQVYWELNVLNDIDAGRQYEVLSAFMNVNDSDGFDDIVNIYIIHDESEMFWTLDQNNWAIVRERDENWLGSNSISTANKTPLPRGDYRVLIVDAGGDRSEGSFYLDADSIDTKSIAFPVAEIEEREIFFTNVGAEFHLWIYTQSDDILKFSRITKKQLHYAEIFARREEEDLGDYFYIYSQQPLLGYNYLSGPYYFREQVE